MKQLAILKDKGKGNHGGTNPINKDNILLLTEKRLSEYENNVPFLTKLDVPQTAEQLTVAGADETGDLQYYAYATNFPVLTKFYPATPKTINLSVGDATFGRVDLILANKPDTVGGMGYITKSEGTPSLNYTPNNIDLNTQYIIKWIYVAPNATVGVDVTPKPSRTYLSEFINDGNGDIAKPFITVDDLSNNTIQSVVGGNNITIDNTDPLNPIISSIASTYPPPYIDIVIPDSTLPSTTGNFELHGSNFKEDMTVAFAGQTVNYKVFHSSNWVTVNVTTGATEGLFSIVLNNGISRTFPNAYMVVLGTVFTPLTAEWTLTEPIDVENDKVMSETWGSYGTAVWSKVFDYTKNISVRFNFTVSPLGIIGVWNATFYPHLALKNVSDNIKRFELSYSSESTFARLRHKSLLVSPAIILYQATEGTVLGSAQIVANKVIEYRFVGGIMYLYINNVLTYTYADVITENLKLEIYINKHDVKNIKYIELA